MMRHASIVDNLLPAGLVSLPHRIRLRYVLKKELLWDPVLDIGGQRLPNVFVRREGDSATEITRIRRLAIGLTERDGVLIYPEGTRFGQEARSGDPTIGTNRSWLADRARRFRRLLPPRPGGPISLLDSGADVVMCAHHGLEGLARVSDVLRAGLVGRTIHVGFRRIEADQIPLTAANGWPGCSTSGNRSTIGSTRSRPRSGDAGPGDRAGYDRSCGRCLDARHLASQPPHPQRLDRGHRVGFGLCRRGLDGVPRLRWRRPRRWLLTGLTTVWGLRLSVYLAMRNLGKKEDYRYQEMRRRQGERFAIASLWTVFGLQGVLMWVVSLPVQVGQVPATPPSLTWIDYLGAAVWLVVVVRIGRGLATGQIQGRPGEQGRSDGPWALAVYPPPQLLR